ncbi:hypothetical protein [Xylophilus sp.]|uniref:hypothetical protein n=1 Tax=Xylophilus sp. TaxID=2653893 RepID=UPI002D7E24C9|nr:hypothetical protein [Xylophilus sp.]
MTAAPVAARPRIGLALGSGSARGLAHVGVLRAVQGAGVGASGGRKGRHRGSDVPNIGRGDAVLERVLSRRKAGRCGDGDLVALVNPIARRRTCSK